MKFADFEKLFTLLIEQKNIRYDFIDALPESISGAFFDNEYITCLEKENDALLRLLFKDALFYDILYFVYEDAPHVIRVLLPVEKQYTIYSLDEMLEYFKTQYKWD